MLVSLAVKHIESFWPAHGSTGYLFHVTTNILTATFWFYILCDVIEKN